MPRASRTATKKGKKRAPPVKRAGRPSAFRPEYVADAARLCLLGATDDELAEHYGVARSTVSLWKLKYPDFSDAIKEAKRPADATIAGALFGRAKGAEWVEQQAFKCRTVVYGDNGKRVREEERVEVVEVVRRAPPDTTACIFWLKNRRPDLWRDRTEVGVGKMEELSDAELQAIAAGKVPTGSA